MKAFLKIIVLFSLFINLTTCKDQLINSEIDPDDPVANAGDNQFINVGSYFILDASKSTKGKGDTLFFKWFEDPANPEQFSINNFNTTYYFRAAIKEGTYKYSLIANNGIKNSKPAQLVVIVGPRASSIIKDTVLEANIRYVTKKQNGEFTEADFLSFSFLLTSGYVISSIKIKKLDGIERCQNLKVLNLSLQSITDLRPLSNLNNLEQLEVDQNWDLMDVKPLANLNNLKYLNISWNSITDISSLSTLRNLISLRILGNPQYHLTDISAVRNMMSLKEFTCAFIPNPDLSVFSNLKELLYFYCSYSQIKDLSGLKNCNNLIEIAVTANELSDITTLINHKELQTFWAAGNKIENIGTLQFLEKLRSLILDNNNIKDIKPLVDNLGIGKNTTIMLRNNPLNDKSINEYIPQLTARGVNVIR